MSAAPAELAHFLARLAGIEIVGTGAVLPGFAAFIRGDLVWWAGPIERIPEVPPPTDCRRVCLNVDDWRAWYGGGEEKAA